MTDLPTHYLLPQRAGSDTVDTACGISGYTRPLDDDKLDVAVTHNKWETINVSLRRGHVTCPQCKGTQWFRGSER